MLTGEEIKNNRKDVQILEDSKFIWQQYYLLRKYLRYTIKFINTIYTV